MPSTGLRSIAYGHRTPDFEFDTGSGTKRLSALYGKPIVLNFWATWCPPCTAELPLFTKLQAEYGDRVALLTLSDEEPGVARAYTRGHGYALPVVEDPNNVVFDKYSVRPVPVTLVLGVDGTVSHVSVGELDWPELKGAVERVLGVTAS